MMRPSIRVPRGSRRRSGWAGAKRRKNESTMPRYCPRRVEAIVNDYVVRTPNQPRRLAAKSERAAQTDGQGEEGGGVDQSRRKKGDEQRRIEAFAHAVVCHVTGGGGEGGEVGVS